MVTPLGATAPECAQAWREGRCATRRPLPELAGTPLEDVGVAVLPGFDPSKRLGGRRMLKYMSDAAVLGCVAAREALEDASAKRRFSPERMGIFAGTGMAAADVREIERPVRESIDERGEFSCRLLGERGLAVTNPLLSFKILANMPPCLISIMEGIKGPNFIFTPWEGQTGAALLEAHRSVASGEVDCALAGAADSAAHPATFVYLRQAGFLQDSEFPASGAAYLCLERYETARRDGASIYAYIRDVRLDAVEAPISDPLSERLGRLFAAAPAVLCGLACMTDNADDRRYELALCGVDRQRVKIELEFPA